MAKPNLRQALSHQPAAQPPVRPNVAASTNADQPRPRGRRPDRIGRKLVGGYFDRPVHKQISIMAAEMERDIEDLVGEALNDFFAKNGRPELVVLKTQKPTT
jgi:antitoxin-like ribbon-helix-helix protein